MKLIIRNTLKTAVFFEMYHSISKSYGITLDNKGNFFETKEYEDNLKNAMALLALDELLTRHIYPSYETGDTSNIEENIDLFTEIDGECESINKLIKFISNEGHIS